MSLTLDNIAKALIDWCILTSPKLSKNFKDNGTLENNVKNDFTNYINRKKRNAVINEQPIYESADKIDLVFNPQAINPSDRIIAEFSVEDTRGADFEKDVLRDIDKLSALDNIKNDYKNATRCIISLYYNTQNRNQLHDKEFIEIYNDLEIGCAMKRLK